MNYRFHDWTACTNIPLHKWRWRFQLIRACTTATIWLTIANGVQQNGMDIYIHEESQLS